MTLLQWMLTHRSHRCHWTTWGFGHLQEKLFALTFLLKSQVILRNGWRLHVYRGWMKRFHWIRAPDTKVTSEQVALVKHQSLLLLEVSRGSLVVFHMALEIVDDCALSPRALSLEFLVNLIKECLVLGGAHVVDLDYQGLEGLVLG